MYRHVMSCSGQTIPHCAADKNYLLAIELYGQAIDCNPLHAVYHANRAFAHIRMETYGSAVEDATEAIAIDAKYVKVHPIGITRLLPYRHDK